MSDNATMPRPPDMFAIEIDYRAGIDAPSRVFKALADMVEAAERADRLLARSISVEVEPVLLLEDIEKGSVRSWLRSSIKGLPDHVIASGEVKKLVGHFLVRGKRAIIAWADRHPTITTRDEVVELQDEIRTLADHTQVNRIPAYTAPTVSELAQTALDFRDAAAQLGDGEAMRYRVATETLPVSRTFDVAPEHLEELVTARSLQSRARMIVKVKKPDFLGSSKWELHHGRRTIYAAVEDGDWLARFRGRDPSALLAPGDAIDVEMRVDAAYGHDSELVRETYSIERVLGVIPPPSQTEFWSEAG